MVLLLDFMLKIYARVTKEISTYVIGFIFVDSFHFLLRSTHLSKIIT